ncbi:ImmA/IrrE family metallo-endopeptidase [Bacillus sp. FJAT-28004]|uniref:ImmA/IrrE family metallo-endopeptidase n=1 Tax=Bacillus sp. FJAT-28004 TaxID=1679165 RepID=UPI0006B3F9C1|nr:ImmA/IrrE family metallo-endopeptidase [Bacillus sp. FJAT-28004]
MRTLDFHLYRSTDIEIWLTNLYKYHGIFSPSDLTIKSVSEIFNIAVNFYSGPCFAEWEEGGYSLIFINNKMSDEEQRMEFFHELCHPLRHTGIQGNMPIMFQELQEAQASQFQLVASMPIYLLSEIQPERHWQDYIHSIAEAFHYPVDFVESRLQQVIARIEQERRDRSIRIKQTNKPSICNYSDETMKILDRLSNQVAERKLNYSVKRQSNL